LDYGSGFPKSLDVSKAIDKRRDDDTKEIHAVVRWLEQKRKDSGVTRREVEKHFDTENIGQSIFTITSGSTPRVPTWAQWGKLKLLFSFDDSMDAEVWRLNGRKGKPGEAWFEREVIGQGKSGKTAIWNEAGKMGNFDLTAPTTSEAQQWSGWGTALKPAFEPVVVGRKPFGKGVTVAENVLAWGVGGLNIDGSRIGSRENSPQSRPASASGVGNGGVAYGARDGQEANYTQGRWPANVILDEVTAGLLDEQSGISGSGKMRTEKRERNKGWANSSPGPGVEAIDNYGDSGGASRFFYQAKASKRDRNEGLEGLEEKKNAGSYSFREDGSLDGKPSSPRSNFHPTVKPTQLMRYLIKLVTPPGGTVLDPFTGSGSTGKAALLDGYKFVGAELTAEYLPIIEGRLRWALEQDADVDETLF
jgi:hypothetical protein